MVVYFFRYLRKVNKNLDMKPTPFFIKGADRGKVCASLHLRVHDSRFDLTVSTRLRVSVDEWQLAVSSPEAWVRHQRCHRLLHARLLSIEQAVEELCTANASRSDIAECIRRIAVGKPTYEVPAPDTRIYPYLCTFADEITGGTRLTAGRPYAHSTCRTWRQYIKVYEAFDPQHRLRWQDIDRRLADSYISRLREAGYSPKVVGKYLNMLRALVNAAHADGLHDNHRASALLRPCPDTDSTHDVYLSTAELDALYRMPLAGLEERVRDVFLVGCYTAQRISDYNRLRPDDFRTTRNGTPVMRLVQRKTRTEVVVPVTHQHLQAILRKYDYDMPRVNETVLNRYIKRILGRLSATVTSLREPVARRLTKQQREARRRQGLPETMTEVRPRYECVTSHTARRTGITNMYLSHRYTSLQMMQISGHKTERIFRRYIKLTAEEIAEETARSGLGANRDRRRRRRATTKQLNITSL